MMSKKKPARQEIDTTLNWGAWEKEPSVFPWYYDEKETCYIIEGRAEVEDMHGNVMSFGKGDWVEFEAGLECTWKISETIRKKFRFGN